MNVKINWNKTLDIHNHLILFCIPILFAEFGLRSNSIFVTQTLTEILGINSVFLFWIVAYSSHAFLASSTELLQTVGLEKQFSYNNKFISSFYSLALSSCTLATSFICYTAIKILIKYGISVEFVSAIRAVLFFFVLWAICLLAKQHSVQEEQPVGFKTLSYLMGLSSNFWVVKIIRSLLLIIIALTLVLFLCIYIPTP
ncbi:hypothetical protein [Maridesulfovibrio sp.]|uniref:hypothetical protein n=1 Tax=unclassified Maridesulfovibrio TaxID=2794999 RepID=UPI003B00F5D9